MPTDRWLLWPKLLYFTLNCLCYSTYTFTAHYFYRVWGVTDADFGYMLVLCAVSFTGSILWNALADRTGAHKGILLSTTAAYAAFFLLLKTELFIDQPYRIRFAFVAFCYGASNFCVSALFPLLDSQIFVLLSRDARFSKSLFGRQRLFGSLGQSFITVLLGCLIDDNHFDPIFYSLLASTVLFCGLVAFGIPGRRAAKAACIESPEQAGKAPDDASSARDRHPSSPPPQKEEGGQKLSFWVGALGLIRSPGFAVFISVILLASTSRAVVGNYLPQYFKNCMKLSETQYSIMLQARLITELAAFFLGKQMLDRFGPHWMLLVGQVAGLARVLSYALLPSRFPWTLAPTLVELLKGINNACLISAGARIAHDLASDGTAAVAQGLFSGIHSNLAMAAAGIVGGITLAGSRQSEDAFRYLFKCTSVISLAGILLSLFYQLLPVRRSTR